VRPAPALPSHPHSRPAPSMSIVCPDAQEPSGQRLYLYDTRQRAKKTLQQVSTAIVHSTNQPLARDGWHRRYRRHRPDGHAATLPAPAKHPKMWRTGQFYVAPIPAALVRSRISCREYLHRHEQLTSGLRTGVATAASTCLIHIPKAFPMSAPTRARCCVLSSCTHTSQTPRVSPAQQAWHRPTHKQHAMPRKRNNKSQLEVPGGGGDQNRRDPGYLGPDGHATDFSLGRAAELRRRRSILPREHPRSATDTAAAGTPHTHSTIKAVCTHEPARVAGTPARTEPRRRRRMCPARAAGAAGSAEPLRGLPPRSPPLLALGVYVL
jgi:hypothetical protein